MHPDAHGGEDLQGLAALVYERSGISPARALRKLASLRLARRREQLGLASLAAYEYYLRRPEAREELTALLDAVTTNHTSFFREPAHFAWLRDALAPTLEQPLDVWCAASATGEEPVSIAITLCEAGLTSFRVLASDISTAALDTARAGIYPVDALDGLPASLLRRYFEKGLQGFSGLARVSAAVRAHLEFEQINLMHERTIDRTFQLIFCRNVLIYFDQASRQRAVSMLESHLAPGGHLVVAHTERLTGLDHGLRPAGPSIYWKPA